MKPAILTAAIAALAIGIVTPGQAAQESPPTYYSDIRPILVDTCMRCHVQEGMAWSMEDPEETYAKRRMIALLVGNRAMPPWLAAAGHQEYVGDLSLGERALETIAAWREAGFPEGDPRPDPQRRHEAHGSFEADLSLELIPDGAYTPDPSRDDDYRCFVVDWSEPEPRYVTAFRTVPGNLNVSHHTVVYAIEPDMVDRFKELEAEEPAPGYQCFGGALPDRLGDRSVREDYEARYPDGVRELARGNRWLAHWAPGMFGRVFPEGTGIRMEPGAALVVQMHYYSADAPGEADAGTRMDFRVADSVERPAFHYPHSKPRWLRGASNGSMVIPAGETATYQDVDRLEDLLRLAAAFTGISRERIQALEIHSANLHMHGFGHSGSISLIDGHGRVETLLEVPDWDLAWQRDFTFVEPKVFFRDQLEEMSMRVTCTFSNPTEEPVYGGYGSDEEMCFNFPYIAVREGEPVTGSAERD